MARQQETQREGIVLDDGTWVDVGRDGRWHPTAGERTRAGVLLGLFIAILAMVALLASVGSDDDEDRDDDVVASDDTTATTEEQVVTTTRNIDRPGPLAMVCAGRSGDAGVTVGLFTPSRPGSYGLAREPS